MTTDTVTVPISLMIFLGGIIVSMVGALLSFSGHLLISIRSSLSKIVQEMAVHGTQVDARLTVLERHDAANQEEEKQMTLFLRQQAGYPAGRTHRGDPA